MKDVKCNTCHMVQQVNDPKGSPVPTCAFCGSTEMNVATSYEMRMGRISFSAEVFSNPNEGFSKALFSEFHPFHTELPMHGIGGHRIIMTGYSMLFSKIVTSHDIPFYDPQIRLEKGKAILESMIKMNKS